MSNKYTYDNVDNILGITNAAKPASGDIGGASSHVYEYDAINRLVSAQGSAKDQTYELQMRYDAMSNPLQKDTISYEYETYSHPNAVSRAGSKIFKYDANGNPISIEDTTANTLRVMQWDEENRLQSLGDDGYVSRYTYNHTGERVVKSHGGTTVAYVNGAPQGVIWYDRDNWTAYVSPYMVVNGDRFTKHYYVGSQRVASKIGVGEFNNLYDASKSCVTAGQKDYAERVSLITQSRDDYNAALGIAPGPPTAKGIYGEAEYSGAYGSYSIKPLGNYDVPTGWPSKPYKRPYGGTPGAPVMYQKPSDPDETGAGYGYSNAEGLSENDVYFYHSDHLGSTSYITDKDGNAVQYLAYKPFGETLVDEHAVSYDSPWKFNGKEWDSETGLYYYGARYYESELAIWYGIDRYAEKFPWQSGYCYAGGNPVGNVDVNGDSIFIKSGENLTVLYRDGKVFTPDGKEYSVVRRDWYLRKVITALNKITQYRTGKEGVETLSNSKNRITIQKGYNHCEATEKRNAVMITQLKSIGKETTTGYEDLIGSSSDVFWDPSTSNSGPDTKGNTSRPSYIGLAHELGHAIYANNGTANYELFNPDHSDAALRKITKDEFNAVRFENSIRKEAAIPLRKAYTYDSNGNFFMSFN